MSRLLRRQALSIFRAALAAADPVDAVLRHLRSRDFSRFRHIYVIGAGKAGASMALAAERVLGRRIAAGLVNVKYGNTAKLRRIELNPCGHPLPDEAGVAGATRIAEIAAQAGADDLVLCLISGGASALLPLPAAAHHAGGKTGHHATPAGLRRHHPRIQRRAQTPLAHQGRTTGAPRRARRGGIAAALRRHRRRSRRHRLRPHRARCLHLRRRPRHPGEIRASCERVPTAVRQRVERGVRGELPGNSQAGRPRSSAACATCWWATIAWRSTRPPRRARELGFRTLVLASEIQGETREIARMHAAIAREIVSTPRPVKPPACIITGGETTVTLRGDGLGGRNQEFVLAAALEIAGLRNVVVLSAGTDGSDGPTDAAGAIADGDTLRRNPEARRYLDRNDSYHYFQSLDDLVITGPTNTNVMDVRILLVGGARVSFWRKEVIQPALDRETRKHMEEQLAWIAREPANARPYLPSGGVVSHGRPRRRSARPDVACRRARPRLRRRACLARRTIRRARRLPGCMAPRAPGRGSDGEPRAVALLTAQRAGIARHRESPSAAST